MSYRIVIYRLALCALLFSAGSGAWSADTPAQGGQGVLREILGANTTFRPQSDTVLAVEVKYEIFWKLWSLMGEPVGNYHLAWQLQSIRLKDPSGQGGSIVLWPQNLPAELQAGAAALELYLDGHSGLDGGTTLETRHRFNTGVAVRAGTEKSFNVPESANWNGLFFRGQLQACSSGKDGPTYLSAAEAKQRFIKGVSLSDFKPCPSSGISNLTSLESAISRLCSNDGAAKKYPFCPKAKADQAPQTTATTAIDDAFAALEGRAIKPAAMPGSVKNASSGGNAIGDAFAKMEADNAEKERQRLARELLRKRLAEETAKYRLLATAACNKTLGSIDACYAKSSCRQPPGPSQEQCRSIPGYPQGKSGFHLTAVPRPGDVCYVNDAECRDAKAQTAAREREDAEDLQRRQGEWRSSFSALNDQCKQSQKERQDYANCQQQYAATCNPKGLTQEACVSEQIEAHGPTEKDVTKLLQRESAQERHIEQPPDGLLPALKRGLKEAVECKPQAGKSCPERRTPNQNPGGIRG